MQIDQLAASVAMDEIVVRVIGERTMAQLQDILGETAGDYVVALGIFIVLSAVFAFVQWIALRQIRKFAARSKTDIDDMLLDTAKSVQPSFYFYFAFYIAVQMLAMPAFLSNALGVVLVVWAAYQIVRAGAVVIKYAFNTRLAKGKDETTRSALKMIGRLSIGALWGLGILMVLSNFGIDVTSLIAGLGIGGIAVAFALQNILSDLFGSFSLYFDKPFEVGDFIIVGEDMGTVKHIGIKTTRIQALEGHTIVMANNDLTVARINNYKQMNERRVAFRFGVVYETPKEKLADIPTHIEKIVEKTDGARLDRAHFANFGDSALEYEVVYYVTSADYNEYMDIQQSINLQLVEVFEKEGIEFAYPTQKILLSRGT